jgi:hypothetical protein
MAGDNYQVKAYLDLREALDTDAAAPAGAERDVAVGSFEMWRQITLPEHFKKCNQVTQAMPNFAKYYVDAFIEVDDQSGAPVAMTKAQYDAAFNAAKPTAVARLNGWNVGFGLVAKYSLPAGVSQYDLPRYPGLGGKIVKFFEGVWHEILSVFGADSPPPPPTPTAWVATFLPYGDFKEAIKRDKGLSNSALNTLLQNNALGDEKAYADKTKDFAIEIATDMCKAKATKDGVTVLQFDWASSLEELIDGDHQINGNACFKSRGICGFALYNTTPSAEQTPAHEIGHCVCLPHAPRLGRNPAGALVAIDDVVWMANEGIARDRHDDKNRNCLMSYQRPRPGFCGLCLIRLRGWDESKFNRLGSLANKA